MSVYIWSRQNARLFLAATVLSTATKPVIARVDFTTRNTYYEISDFIDSRRKLWQAIDMWGPRSNSHRSALGTASRRISHKRRVLRSGKRCSITDVNVTVRVVLTLPQWSKRYRAKPHLQRYFDCISRTVTVHEKRHAQISYETGKRLEAALRSDLLRVPCDDFRRREGATVRRIIEQGRIRQKTFDRMDYAKPRYQKCHRMARKQRSPTKRVDIMTQKQHSKSAMLTKKKAAQKNTETTKTIDAAREATLRLVIGMAGLVALGVILFSLFAVLMRWAQRKELSNEMQETADPQSSVETRSAGQNTSYKRAQAQNVGGFGKRKG